MWRRTRRCCLSSSDRRDSGRSRNGCHPESRSTMSLGNMDKLGRGLNTINLASWVAFTFMLQLNSFQFDAFRISHEATGDTEMRIACFQPPIVLTDSVDSLHLWGVEFQYSGHTISTTSFMSLFFSPCAYSWALARMSGQNSIWPRCWESGSRQANTFSIRILQFVWESLRLMHFDTLWFYYGLEGNIGRY